MKQLILLAAAVLLPLGNLQASGTGFKAGQEFELKVSKVTSTKQIGYFGSETKNPVPKSVPKFKKGTRIAFKIDKKGALSTKKFRISFAHASKGVVEYNAFVDGEISTGRNAEIDKKGKNATGGTLRFFIHDYSGVQPVFQTVVYELK